MKKILIYLLITSLFSCAKIVPPSGGEKDIVPPKVTSYKPGNFSTQFINNKIEIKFDEFIKLNTSAESVIISPKLEKKPLIELVGKKIKISFKEPLKPNTTYIINFGNSIKDYNEGNELKNLKYVFSTGKIIDSLKISGTIKTAFDNKPKENIMVGLYSNNQDSILYKKPLYYTKTDINGKYSIENLKPGNYKIAALEDKNLNYIFDQESEMVGFRKTSLNLDSTVLGLVLNVFTTIEKTKVKKYINSENNHIEFIFNKPFTSLMLDISNIDSSDIHYYSTDKKRFHYWYNNKLEKTSFFFLINEQYKDTFNVDLKQIEKLENFDFTIEKNLSLNKTAITINFPFPVLSFKKEFLFIQNKENNYTAEWENNKQKLTITTEGNYDTLVVKHLEGCYTSFHKLQSKSHIDTLINFTENNTKLSLLFKKQEDIVIELYDKEMVLVKTRNVSRETNIHFKNIKPGKYYIRVYKDLNNNGVWDSGILKTKKQAEGTLLFKEINIDNNWDKELNLDF